MQRTAGVAVGVPQPLYGFGPPRNLLDLIEDEDKSAISRRFLPGLQPTFLQPGHVSFPRRGQRSVHGKWRNASGRWPRPINR